MAKQTDSSLVPHRPMTFSNSEVDIDRLTFDVAKPTARLIQSVDRYGVIEPVIVSFDAFTNTYKVIDGRRRAAAAREVKRKRRASLFMVPIREIRQIDSYPNGYESVLALMLNGCRSDSPLVEFNALNRLNDYGYDEDEIADVTGTLKVSNRKRLRLNDLAPTIRIAWENELIADGVADTISREGEDVQYAISEHLLAFPKAKLTAAQFDTIRKRIHATNAVVALNVPDSDVVGDLVDSTMAITIAQLPGFSLDTYGSTADDVRRLIRRAVVLAISLGMTPADVETMVQDEYSVPF